MHKIFEQLIEQARKWEDNGVEGSVQRLLRLKDNLGRTAEDFATGSNKEYLKHQLEEAEERESKILYDFGLPTIKEVQTEGISLNYIRNTLSEQSYHIVDENYGFWFPTCI